MADRDGTSAAEEARRGGWIRRMLPFVLARRGSLVRTFVAGLVWAGVSTAVPVVERHVVDNVILASKSALTPWLVLLFVLGAAGFAAARTRRFHSSKVMLEVSFGLRGAIHRELQRLDLQAHGEMATGQLVSRANSDISLVLTVLRVLPTLTSNLVLMIASLGVMFYLSPVLALISLVILPLLVLGAYRMRTRLYPATWDVQQRTGDVAQVVDQAVTGVRVVKGFGQEQREFERLSETASGLYGSSMRATPATTIS